MALPPAAAEGTRRKRGQQPQAATVIVLIVNQMVDATAGVASLCEFGSMVAPTHTITRVWEAPARTLHDIHGFDFFLSLHGRLDRDHAHAVADGLRCSWTTPDADLHLGVLNPHPTTRSTSKPSDHLVLHLDWPWQVTFTRRRRDRAWSGQHLLFNHREGPQHRGACGEEGRESCSCGSRASQPANGPNIRVWGSLG